MEADIRQFHLAVPVLNLAEARAFYADVLGAKEGRSTSNHVDFDLYGHHFVIHEVPIEYKHLFQTFPSDFHGELVPVPHFGLNLSWSEWLALAERVKEKRYDFYDPPHVRLAGRPGEHATLFLLDPSGNALEFKAFRNHREVFERIFHPETASSDVLDGLVEEAAEGSQAASRRAL